MKTNLILKSINGFDYKLIIINKENVSQDSDLIFSLFDNVSHSYPNVKTWLKNKVIPDLILGLREFILVYDNNKIAGFLLLKNTSEKKLCTLFVFEEYRKKSIGNELIIIAKERLNCEKPFLTVSSSNYVYFKTLLKKHGFVLSKEVKNCYNQDTELFFN